MASHAKQELLSNPDKRGRKRRGGGRKELAVDNEVHQEGEEEAPIQCLPDVLLSCVLSKLSNSKDVIMASMVCKRWSSCTRHVQHLCFSIYLVELQKWALQPAALGWVQLIGRSEDLRKLCICSYAAPDSLQDRHTETYILDCLSRVSQGLEILHLNLGFVLTTNILNMIAGFQHLVELQLCNPDYPIDSEFFPRTCKFTALKKCELFDFRMADQHLEELLIQCPVLEELTVSDCPDFERPTLTSGSLRKLEFLGREYDTCLAFHRIEDASVLLLLTINAPQLASLALTYVPKVVCDSSDNLQDIHFKSWVDPCFKHLPRLHKLSIEGARWPQYLLMRVLQQCSNATYVSLSCYLEFEMWNVTPAKEFFYHISQVETLEICSEIYEVLLYSGGWSTFCFPRLRTLYFDADRSDEALTKETLLKFLLDSSNLQQVVIFLWSHPISPDNVSFLESLLNLQGAYPQVAFDVQEQKYDQTLRECICRIEFYKRLCAE